MIENQIGRVFLPVETGVKRTGDAILIDGLANAIMILMPQGMKMLFSSSVVSILSSMRPNPLVFELSCQYKQELEICKNKFDCVAGEFSAATVPVTQLRPVAAHHH